MSPDTPVDPQPDEEARVEPATGPAPQASEETAKAQAKAAKPAKPAKPARARKAAKAKEAAEDAEAATAAAGKPAKRPSRAKKAAAAKEPAAKPAAAEKRAAAEKPAAKPAETVAEAKAEPAAASRGAAKGAREAPRRKVVRARARFVRTSARKARMVCGHLRGKSVQEARAILAFTPREVARDWSKLLESAVANAESNHELLEDDLIVREAYADEGPTIKRFRPRAMGRATPIRKRTSHLTITLTPGPERPTSKRHG
jgi:ribosomal protein L22